MTASPQPDDRGRFPDIGDHALLGDCASAALVTRDGTIDWLCWPRFDSPSLFAALLDPERGGHFALSPPTWRRVERAYVDDTNAVDTRFFTDAGVLRLRDCMIAAPEMEEGVLWPDHQLVREVTCEEGEVEVRLRCDPRFDYGRRRPRWELRGSLGCFCQHEGGAPRGAVLVLRSEIAVEPDGEAGLVGSARLREGERRTVSLSFDAREPATVPALGEVAAERVERTLAYWRDWAGRCEYDGPYRDAVVRSALTLKMHTMAASGALVAAPTTSLPEREGGVRNWDYRFCWLRDAAFTLRALMGLGYEREGRAFFSWLLHTTRQTAPKLSVLYGVFGDTESCEAELEHLEGYRGSRPVRVGNRALDQLQLDTYGTVIATAFEFVRRGGGLDAWQARLIARLAQEVCERWEEPDEGIWEIRCDRRRHTYSAAMSWVALDRALEMEEEGVLRVSRQKLERTREEIRSTIETRGFDPESGSYVSVLDGSEVDASLLLLSVYGYARPDGERMVATWERIRSELGHGALLRRYGHRWEDGLPAGEGAFAVCGFWAVEYLAQLGRWEEARERFEKLLSHANDVGLLGEEIEPADGGALGNFPQAFSHLGLISAALSISRRRSDREEARLESHLREGGATPRDGRPAEELKGPRR